MLVVMLPGPSCLVTFPMLTWYQPGLNRDKLPGCGSRGQLGPTAHRIQMCMTRCWVAQALADAAREGGLIF